MTNRLLVGEWLVSKTPTTVTTRTAAWTCTYRVRRGNGRAFWHVNNCRRAGTAARRVDGCVSRLSTVRRQSQGWPLRPCGRRNAAFSPTIQTINLTTIRYRASWERSKFSFISDKRNGDEHETTRPTKNRINPGRCWEDKTGDVTADSDRYMNMVNDFIVNREPRRTRISGHNLWSQQNGATAHTARASTEAIRTLFPNRVISRFGHIPRLASSLTGSVNTWLCSSGIPQITCIWTDPGRFEDQKRKFTNSNMLFLLKIGWSAIYFSGSKSYLIGPSLTSFSIFPVGFSSAQGKTTKKLRKPGKIVDNSVSDISNFLI